MSVLEIHTRYGANILELISFLSGFRGSSTLGRFAIRSSPFMLNHTSSMNSYYRRNIIQSIISLSTVCCWIRTESRNCIHAPKFLRILLSARLTAIDKRCRRGGRLAPGPHPTISLAHASNRNFYVYLQGRDEPFVMPRH
jgi:hypothetical protein